MDPITIYLVGVLLTGLVAGHADSASVVTASGVGGTTSLGVGAIALSWPVSVPVLAVNGAAASAVHALTPDTPAKRDLIGINSGTPPADQEVFCVTQKIVVSDLDAIPGNYRAYAWESLAPLQLVGSTMGQGTGIVTSAIDWRGGTTWEDADGVEPRVRLDWVGTSVNSVGKEMAELRACTLKSRGAK